MLSRNIGKLPNTLSIQHGNQDSPCGMRRIQEIRKRFEEFLVKHKGFINQLSHSKGGGTRPVDSILEMFWVLMEQLESGVRKDDTIVAEMRTKKSLKKLVEEEPQFDEPVRRRFSKAVERAKVVESTLKTRARCPECRARLAPSLRSKEHRQPKDDGGMGTLENLDFLHPFCNQLRVEKQQAKKKKSVR
jgi:hypothetical protein